MAGSGGANHAGTFFHLLGEAERQRLEGEGRMLTYQARYCPSTEDKPTKDVIVVMEGLAAAVRDRMLLCIYGAGDIVGADALLGQRPRPETVQALTPSTALVFPAARFAELARSPGIASALRAAMACRAQVADKLAATRAASYQVRLARALVELSDRAEAQENEGVANQVEFSQETLGSWIHAHRSTTNRVLSGLSEQGVLRTGYRKIVVTDPGRLRCIAAGDS